MRKYYIVPVVVAAVMSIISSRYLFVGSGLSLIPWGLLALSFGFIAHSKKEAIRLGAIYGFGQAFIFLWVDKAGSLTFPKFFVLLVIITLLGVAAAGCAALAAWLGYRLKTKVKLPAKS